MEIKQKFTLEVIVLLVLLSIVTLTTINNTLIIQNNFFILNHELIPALSLLKDMRLAASDILSLTLEFSAISAELETVTDEKAQKLELELSEINSKINARKNEFNNLLSQHKQINNEILTSAKFEPEIEKKWDRFELFSEKFIEYETRDISGIEFVKIKNEFQDSKNLLFSEIDSDIQNMEKIVKEKEIFVIEIISQTTIVIFAVLFVFIFAVVFLRYIILKSILIPIIKLSEMTKEIAKGNLRARTKTFAKDEMGKLLSDVNQMATDLEKTQQKLLDVEKFSVIGELAARMAHDMRNPLTNIKMSISYLEKKSDWGEKEIEMVKIAHNAIERIDFQIQDVLEFVKSNPLNIDKTSLLSLLRTTISNKRIPKGVQIILPKNDTIVECDSRKIEVVFINILKNALDAVGESGKIIFRFDESENAVKIEIEDSGPGVTPENQSKIFEPLFTTKQRGTGLGLASSKRIIEQHNGTINFSNNPTIFSINLPKKIR